MLRPPLPSLAIVTDACLPAPCFSFPLPTTQTRALPVRCPTHPSASCLLPSPHLDDEGGMQRHQPMTPQLGSHTHSPAAVRNHVRSGKRQPVTRRARPTDCPTTADSTQRRCHFPCLRVNASYLSRLASPPPSPLSDGRTTNPGEKAPIGQANSQQWWWLHAAGRSPTARNPIALLPSGIGLPRWGSCAAVAVAVAARPLPPPDSCVCGVESDWTWTGGGVCGWEAQVAQRC